MYPGLVQLKVSCPVEVVMLSPRPEVAKLKTGPIVWLIDVVAGAEEIYPGLVQENAMFCPEVE